MNRDCWDLVAEFALTAMAGGFAFRATCKALRDATACTVAAVMDSVGWRLDEAAVDRLKERHVVDSAGPFRLFRWALVTCGARLKSISFDRPDLDFGAPTFGSWLLRPDDQHGALNFVNVPNITEVSADMSALVAKPSARGRQNSAPVERRREFRNLRTLRIVISRDWCENVPANIDAAKSIDALLKRCQRRPKVYIVAIGEYNEQIGCWVRAFGSCLRRFVFQYSHSWTTETLHSVLKGMKACHVAVGRTEGSRNFVFSTAVKSVTADFTRDGELRAATLNALGEVVVLRRTIEAKLVDRAFFDVSLSDPVRAQAKHATFPDVAVHTLAFRRTVQWTPRLSTVIGGSPTTDSFCFARLSSATLSCATLPATSALQAAVDAGYRRSFPSLASLYIDADGRLSDLGLWFRVLDAPKLTTLRLNTSPPTTGMIPVVLPPALTRLSITVHDAVHAPVVCGPNLTALTLTFAGNNPTVRLPRWVKQITTLRRLQCRDWVLRTSCLLAVIPTLHELQFIPAANDIDVVLQRAHQLLKLTLYAGQNLEVPPEWHTSYENLLPVTSLRELTLHQPLCSVADVEQIARRFPRIHTLELLSERPMDDAVWGALRAAACKRHRGSVTFESLLLIKSRAPIPSCKSWPRTANDNVEIVAIES